MQIVAAPVLPSFAFNKHAFPNRRLVVPAGPNHSTRRNKARFLCVISEAQYQAFVRFAVASSAALSAIALVLTCLLEPFTRTGSLARILASSRQTTGRANPEPML
ncbi:MAG: hypothetical protein ABWY82_24785 [Tardiphaga sp.]